MSKFLILGAFLAAMAGTAGCATTGGGGPGGQADAWDTCRIVTDLGVQLGADSYDPKVGGTDCSSEFAAAGLAMKGFSPTDPATRHIIRFETPEKAEGGKVAVAFSDPCPLCGHGEAATLEWRDGRWVIIERHQTWIS